MSFRATRLVANYGDGSELHFLPDDNSYVWMRPRENKGRVFRFREVAIQASSDKEALARVRRIAADEFNKKMLNGAASKW